MPADPGAAWVTVSVADTATGKVAVAATVTVPDDQKNATGFPVAFVFE